MTQMGLVALTKPLKPLYKLNHGARQTVAHLRKAKKSISSLFMIPVLVVFVISCMLAKSDKQGMHQHAHGLVRRILSVINDISHQGDQEWVASFDYTR